MEKLQSVSFFVILVLVVIFVIALIRWVKPAVEGKDGILQWDEFTSLVFLACYVIGHFYTVDVYVMYSSAFGALGPQFLKFIKAIRSFSPFKKKKDESSELDSHM